MSQDIKEQQLQQISHMFHAYTSSRTLMTAVQLDIFQCISQGNSTVEQVATAINATTRGVRMLLNALVGLQFLKKKEQNYELEPISSRFLVKTSADYIGAMFEIDDLWNTWSHLNQVIKTGHPPRALEQEQKATEFFPHLVKSLHAMSIGRSNRLADILLQDKVNIPLQVLDIACGSGVWSILLAEKSDKVMVTAQDFSKILELTKTYVQRHGVQKQYSYLAGDLKQLDYGENRYDIVILGNIVHSEGEKSSRILIQKLGKALKPHGRIVIIDMFPNNERSAPAYPLLFALNMLVNTTEGDTYTFEEYCQWLNEANIPKVFMEEIAPEFSVVIGEVL
ncbi:O-methyltransferase [Galdieria sulphuraria]|uniref:O-methyltransferase n=1 Tax=Galdieria sulphuraria TaxID=130081 RepID=M2Y0R8_GALSU|nr:O-methyltransferase [Galdieria sulphuraria]EME29523.1 O-methyltransferase [Galdieria sulphuraria]|eukprot:XP_005706043.1 O-methyltransferase [Galdieria sulphuraria]